MQQLTRLNGPSVIGGSRPNALACCRLVCLNPISLAVAFLLAVIIGTSVGPVAAALGLAVAGVALVAVSPLPLTRRLVTPLVVRKERRERHDRRERRLERGGSTRRTELDELNTLVAEIHERDPDTCARLELEELVDLYVEMAILVESYRGSARRSNGLIGDEHRLLPGDGSNGRLRRDLVRRRIAHRDECMRKVDELEAELDAVIEFVRLVAQRVVCPTASDPLEPQLERRVWELDARDTALRQLAADDPG